MNNLISNEKINMIKQIVNDDKRLTDEDIQIKAKTFNILKDSLGTSYSYHLFFTLTLLVYYLDLANITFSDFFTELIKYDDFKYDSEQIKVAINSNSLENALRKYEKLSCWGLNILLRNYLYKKICVELICQNGLKLLRWFDDGELEFGSLCFNTLEKHRPPVNEFKFMLPYRSDKLIKMMNGSATIDFNSSKDLKLKNLGNYFTLSKFAELSDYYRRKPFFKPFSKVPNHDIKFFFY